MYVSPAMINQKSSDGQTHLWGKAKVYGSAQHRDAPTCNLCEFVVDDMCLNSGTLVHVDTAIIERANYDITYRSPCIYVNKSHLQQHHISIPLQLSPPSSNIPPPLHRHPHQTRIRHHHRPCKWLPPPRRAKHPPLTHEMQPRHTIAPHSQLIHRPIVNVIRSIQSYHRSEKCPCPECTGGQRGDVFWCCGWWVDGRGVVDA